MVVYCKHFNDCLSTDRWSALSNYSVVFSIFPFAQHIYNFVALVERLSSVQREREKALATQLRAALEEKEQLQRRFQHHGYVMVLYVYPMQYRCLAWSMITFHHCRGIESTEESFLAQEEPQSCGGVGWFNILKQPSHIHHVRLICRIFRGFWISYVALRECLNFRKMGTTLFRKSGS